MFLALLLSLAPPQAPPLLTPAKDFPNLRYERAWAEAVASNKPLVAFVGVPAVQGVGVSVEMPYAFFVGYPNKCVIVGRPSDGTIHWVKTLSSAASVEDIRESLVPALPVQSFAPPPLQFAPPMQMQSFRGGGGSC